MARAVTRYDDEDAVYDRAVADRDLAEQYEDGGLNAGFEDE